MLGYSQLVMLYSYSKLYGLYATVPTKILTMLYAIACVHVTDSKAALLLHETATSTYHSFRCQHNNIISMLIVTVCIQCVVIITMHLLLLLHV